MPREETLEISYSLLGTSNGLVYLVFEEAWGDHMAWVVAAVQRAEAFVFISVTVWWQEAQTAATLLTSCILWSC